MLKSDDCAIVGMEMLGDGDGDDGDGDGQYSIVVFA